MSNRIVHIDVAKGIGILLVVLGHNWIVLHERGELYRVIYSFHMPLFFLLSGIFFNPAKPLLVTLIEKADSILKPYFITMLAAEIVYRLLGPQEISLPVSLFGIFYGTANLIRWGIPWFLPHLFALFIFAWLVIRATKLEQRTLLFKIILLAVLLTAGYLTVGNFMKTSIILNGEEVKLRGLPFSADIIPITGFYFLLGRLLGRQISNMKPNSLLLCGSLVLFFTLHYFTNYQTNLNLRRYDNLVISTALALLGVYSTLTISVFISKFKAFAKPLAGFGMNSLIILLFHYPIQSGLFQFMGDYSPRKFVVGLMAFAATALITLGLAKIIRWVKPLAWLYLPFKKQTRAGRQRVAS